MKKVGVVVWGYLGLCAVVAGGLAPQAFAGGFVEQLVRQSVEQKLQTSEQAFDLSRMLGVSPSDWTGAVAPDLSALDSGTFDQLIDPSNPSDTRTFKQRYYINSFYASGPGSPVFYYICGEATCTAGALNGAIQSYARKYHGHLVALEHRFYGESQPFPQLTPQNLKYLRTDFALADLARFELFAQNQWGWKGKWIVVGGSYPGSLSAYYRMGYPELAAGSLASSAPVQAKENFEEYDYVVHDRVGAQCAQAMKTAVAEIEKSLNDPGKLILIKQDFDATEVRDPVDFMYIVADMGAMAVQYGMKDRFCKTLLSASNPVQGYATAGKAAFAAFGIAPIQDSFQSAMSVNPDDYLEGFGARQWLYQSCTEFGYFQNAYHDPAYSARSQLINPAFHRRICQQLFGTPPLDTSKVMKELYAPLLNPKTASRILLTNGSNDPWSMLSISQALGNNVNPSLTTYTIQGAAHCDDLRSPSANDSASLSRARAMFDQLLSSWLR